MPDEFAILRSWAYRQAIRQNLLAIHPRGFSALAPLNQNHRRDNYHRRTYKPEGLQGKPKPVKHQDVAEPDGDGRQNDDEE
jgi:hypothetical protein